MAHTPRHSQASTRRSVRGVNSEILSLAMGIGASALVLAAMLMWMLRAHWMPAGAQRMADADPSHVAGQATADGKTTAMPAPTVAALSRRTAAGSGRWSHLTLDEQEILQPLHEDWSKLTVDQRVKWLDVVARYPKLSPEEQQRMQTRMAEWARLSPVERGQARLNFQELRQLSAKERLERWEAYQGLDEGERRQWAERTPTAPAAAVRRTEAAATPQPKSAGTALELAAAQARPEGATVVRAPLGATTHLVSRVPVGASTATAPAPRIASGGDGVDRRTLLPQSAKTVRHGAGETETLPQGDAAADAPTAPGGSALQTPAAAGEGTVAGASEPRSR